MTAPGAAILGCAGPRLDARERAFFRDADPWGFILFARNVDDPAQVGALTAELREVVGRAAPILIDQEGGRVQRLGPPHWRAWSPPLDLAAATDPVRAFWLRYRLIAAELAGLGIDVDCAPLADIAGAATHPFLRNRCYGTDAAAVTAHARAAAEGLAAGGVLPVLKHIPGHGRAVADSHADLPIVDADSDTLRATDFAPFRALADLPMAMTAHVVYRGLGSDAPATTDPAMIALIRDELGFDGLLMSDDIAMGALKGDMGARGAASIAAGCDVVLHCNGDRAEMAQVVAAAGTLDAAAERRAEAALATRRAPDEVDIAALEAELSGLSGG